MTGIELAIQIGQQRPETKVLLISGLGSGILVLDNGWQFLPKPFMAEMLRDRIRESLSEQLPLSPSYLPVLSPSSHGLRRHYAHERLGGGC
jgi:DNA-binding response OmpR family regulator